MITAALAVEQESAPETGHWDFGFLEAAID
jgi:hypothetical protein